MEQKEISIDFTKYGDGELSAEDQRVLDAAREATANSFAPHSGFNVGAAALLDNGEIISGANQESDVYPAGLCAERVLLFNLLANHHDSKIKALAIAAKTKGVLTQTEVFPCGICTQTLIDAEKRQNQPIKIIMSGSSGSIVIDSARKLLPFEFTL